ncbi:Cilia- and flagella-associated protein 44, partial [Perkinsus olseni]
RQMLLLEEALHTIQSNFNTEVLELRAQRRRLRVQFIEDLTKLKDISSSILNREEDAALGHALESMFLNQCRLAGVPQQPSDGSYTAVLETIIEALRKDLPEEYPDGRYNLVTEGRASTLLPEPPREQVSDLILGGLPSAAVNRNQARSLLWDRSESGRVREQLVSAQKDIFLRVKCAVDAFNKRVAALSNDKSKLHADLKMAQTSLITLYEELVLLSNLEEADATLYAKLDKSVDDMTVVMKSIEECQKSLLDKRTEIDAWQVEESRLQSEFSNIINDNPGADQFSSALMKIYRRKVKRPKKKEGGGDDDDDESFDTDLDSDSDVDSNAEEIEEPEEDVCPPGCDQAVFKTVIGLRDKRLDMEEALTEIQKAVDEIKKTHTRLLQKEKALDKEQMQAEEKIQHFQTEKQQKLNLLHTVLLLRFSQMKCLSVVGGDGEEFPGVGQCALLPGQTLRLPETLDGGQVVFTKTALQRLRQRITDLHGEKASVRREYRELKRVYGVRAQENKKIGENLKELERKLEEIQQLKFGQLVDIDDLEKSGISREQEELENRLRDTEVQMHKRLAEWEAKMKEETQVHVELTRSNTEVMEDIAKLGQCRVILDAELDGRIARVALDEGPTSDGKEIEYERMQDLLNMQRKEIATLQAEIELFRRKGGHIYTTVTSMEARDYALTGKRTNGLG